MMIEAIPRLKVSHGGSTTAFLIFRGGSPETGMKNVDLLLLPLVRAFYLMNSIHRSLNLLAFSPHSFLEVLPNILAPFHRSHEPNSKDNSRQWHAPNGLPLGRQSIQSVSVGVPAAVNALAYRLAGRPKTFWEAARVAILSIKLP